MLFLSPRYHKGIKKHGRRGFGRSFQDLTRLYQIMRGFYPFAVELSRLSS